MPGQQQLLNEYLKKLTRLRQAPTAYGPAPHKPVLLLTLFDGIERGWITGNRVYLMPELVAAFRDHWSLLVTTHHSPEFALPFFHLQSSGFWRVVRHDGQPWQDFTKSLPRMQELVHYGTLDDALYALLLDPVARNVLRAALLEKYFPTAKAAYLQRKDTGSYLNDVENELLGEPATTYAAGAGEADEEEAFVRGGLFKRLVPKVYNYTCCITGMRVISTYDVAMVDACHIVPIGRHGSDHVTNGLSLCPNLHRAFDRGLISVDDSYRVLVSDSFGELEGHPYSLRQLLGKPLALPFDQKFYPGRENLAWHQEKVFKK
jgi:putative restriction endonuclease